MKQYDGYLIDLDGTMYLGNESIESAAPFIQALLEANIPYLFVTNNSSKSPIELVHILQKHGIHATEKHIFTSSMATANYIEDMHSRASAFVIGEDGLKYALQEKGIEENRVDPTHVVIGIDRELTYDKLSQACLAIRKGATFVSTNSDAAIPTEEGLLPGNGAITAAVRTSTGVDPLFIGKPSAVIMEQAIEELGIGRNVVMVGDNYDTDIQAGIQAGIDTLLVCTGVTKREEALQSRDQPTYICNDLIEWL
ncbi:MAG TPA: TIGR01457 family HAD-type hydrolase [Bacillota bacterium]|nr:TIGR01457 family HAD-type hydrolase [Bacillota bacterium]